MPFANYAFALLLAYGLAFAAWVTHIVATIKAGSWALLALGGLIFPIGVVHGWLIWLGIV
jgi:hypothetical protein